MGASEINLCFHGIGRPGQEREPGESHYWITEDTFHEVLDAVVGRRDVHLSFDDGNASDVEIGLPALQDRGLSATFFVLAGRLDSEGNLSSDQVRTLVAAGMTVGTHGMDHRPWVGMDDATRQRELVEARDRIGELTGSAVDQAALPLGRYDRELLGHLRSLGYRRVHTSDRARARRGAWLQPRFSLRDTDTTASVRAEALTPPSAVRRAERTAAQLVKRWR